jgi:hypothetical protein
VSVMSATETRRAAGPGHQIVVPRPRAADSEPGHGGRDRASAAMGAPRIPGGPVMRGPAGRAQFQVHELQVRELRVRRVQSRQRAAQVRAAQLRAARPAGGRAGGTRPGGVRLTRRGKAVVAGVAILLAVAALTLILLSIAGGAQASGRGLRPGTPYRGMTQVVVRPGQTLWSIASAAEPAADPRVVIQEIIEANALGGATVQAGQQLWVPKG